MDGVMKWVKRLLWGAVALGIVAAIAWAFRPRPATVETAVVARAPMQVSVDAEGRTRILDRYVMSAPLAGQLARIEWDPGDEVHAGDVLARLIPLPSPLLDPRSREEAVTRLNGAQDALSQAQAGVERARAALEQARREASRQRLLVSHDAAPRAALEQAESDERARSAEFTSARFATEVARHAVDTARSILGRLQPGAGGAAAVQQIEITAPVSGRVLRVLRESAGVVNAGTDLLEVGDPAALEIVADVLTQDAVRVRPHARVSVDRWGGDAALEGHVRLVEPAAFTRTSALGVDEQRVNVVIDIDSPRDRWRLLGDGFRVEVAIETWSSDAAIRVPSGALFRDGNEWAVFVVTDRRARRRTVETGHRSERDVEVTRGLRAGETVIVHPSDALHDGTAVVVR